MAPPARRSRARPSAPTYARLPTEQTNPRTRRLDRLDPLALVTAITAEDRRAFAGVAAVRRPLARAVSLVAEALRAGGRLVYAGAGTSGRLGVLDAAECPPTFGVTRGRVVGVIAGGRRALWRAVEGAEDRPVDAARALARLRVGPADVVCAICASGVTPFALAALRAGRRRGARTVAVTCAPSSRLRALADVVVAPRVGPEVIAGSTRMKAGLATKMVLHTLTTGAMVRVGKVYGNLMVDVRPTNRKLRARAARIVTSLTGLPTSASRSLLRRAGGRPKLAAVMHARGLSAAAARRQLAAHGDDLRAALEAPVATDPLGRFLALREVTPRRIVGLISGTSADGVDAALVEVAGAGADLQVRLLEFASRPYSPPLRARVVAAGEASAPALLDLHYELGEVFAEAAGTLIEGARRCGLAVHLIGSHGQTARHHPRAAAAHGQAATLQIAEPAVIAERTGLPVVADFRPADVAAGGEGAPLVPLVDWLLFRLAARTRACLNIGGIANATVLAGEAANVRAFDLGPGNMPLDLVVHAWTGGAETFDRDGARAARGRIDRGLLAELLAHPYFALAPPKSTGREAFGADFVAPLLGAHAGREADLLRTLTRFIAEGIADGLRRWAGRPVDEVLVSGGGARNRTLMADLGEVLVPAPVRSLDAVGVDPDAKEAVAFAVLANETLFGRPGNVPAATGARGPRVLGKIVLPPSL